MNQYIGKKVTVYYDQTQTKEVFNGELIGRNGEYFIVMKSDGVFKLVFPTLCRLKTNQFRAILKDLKRILISKIKRNR